MNRFLYAIAGTSLVLAAISAQAHPGHENDGLAASLLHLLFGLHGWPSLIAWATALGAVFGVGMLVRYLLRRGACGW
jgi:hydrogenase/urease accessory protein HupE